MNDKDLDIRQSEKWGKYMKGIGWGYHRLESGILVGYKDIKVGNICKVQKFPNLTDSHLKEIEDYCKSIKGLFIKIEVLEDQDMEIFSRNGYEVSITPLAVPSTMIIDLTKSEEELWKNISHSGKYSINRAKREEAKVTFYQNPNDELLKLHYDTCKDNSRRKHYYVQPWPDYVSKRDAWGEESYLALVHQNEKFMASKFYLCHGDGVLYINGGSLEESNKNKSGYMLLWESILYFKKLGYKKFDLEGVDDDRFRIHTKNWGGFSYFKEKFGGEVVRFPYPQIKFLSPVLRFMDKIKSLNM